MHHAYAIAMMLPRGENSSRTDFSVPENSHYSLCFIPDTTSYSPGATNISTTYHISKQEASQATRDRKSWQATAEGRQ